MSNKSLFLKRAARNDNLKIRKGGYHKIEKGDLQEMRRNKKKDIEERLSEDGSATSSIVGYLSNKKQSLEPNKKYTPWYMTDKSRLKHSLSESLKKISLDNILKEIDQIDDRERERVERLRQKASGWRHPLKKAERKKQFKVALPFKSTEGGKQKEFGLKTHSGKPLKGSEEEIAQFEKNREQLGKEKRKPEHRKGLGPRGVAMTARGLGEKSENLVDSYMIRLGMKADMLFKKGVRLSELDPDSKAEIILYNILQKISPVFYKTHLISYDKNWVDEAQIFAQERGRKELDVKYGPGSDKIIHLIAEKIPPTLMLKFASAFKNNPREIMQRELDLRKSSSQTARGGGRIEEPISGEQAPAAYRKSLEQEKEIDKDFEKNKMKMLGDFIDQISSGQGEEVEPEFFGDKPGTPEEEIERSQAKKSGFDPVLAQKLKALQTKYEQGGKDISDLTPEELDSVLSKPEQYQILSRVLMNQDSPYYIKAIELISNKLGVDKDLVEQSIEDMEANVSVHGPQGGSYKTVVKPKDMIKRVDKETFEKRLPVYDQIYNLFSPFKITSKGTTGESAYSPFVDFIKGKIESYERGELAPRIKSAKEKAYRQKRRDIQKLRKGPLQKVEKPSGLSQYRGLGSLGEPKTQKLEKVKHKKTFSGPEAAEELKQSLSDKYRAQKIPHTTHGLEAKKEKLSSLKGELQNDYLRFYSSQSEKGERKLGHYSEKEKQKLISRIKDVSSKIKDIDEKLGKLTGKVREEEGISTTEGLKKYVKKHLVNEFSHISLREMLLSPDNSSVDKEVETKTKAWEKAKPEKKKDFYPKLESLFLGGK